MNLDINDLIGDADIDMECPNCDHEFSVKADKVLRKNAEVKCPACQASIKIQHDESVDRSIKSTNKALKDFERSLKRFGK